MKRNRCSFYCLVLSISLFLNIMLFILLIKTKKPEKPFIYPCKPKKEVVNINNCNVTHIDIKLKNSIEKFKLEIEKEDTLTKRVLYLESLISTKEVVGYEKVRIGREHDGGYIMLNDFKVDKKIAYSFGISNEVSWDLKMAELGYEVFMYDHTIKELPVKNEKFHWFKVEIVGKYKNENSMTLEEILKKNGHMNETDMILKMDIEFSEYPLLNFLPEGILDKFKQIIIEFHGFKNLANEGFYYEAVSALKKLKETHQVIHVHGQAYQWDLKGFGIVGGTSIADFNEVTFVRRKDYTFQNDYSFYPIEKLDFPCCTNSTENDIFLGLKGLLSYE